MREILSLMLAMTCGICALILSFSPQVTKADAPVQMHYEPVIIDTVNVFDIYQPPVEVVEEKPIRAAPTGLLVLSDEDLDLAALMVHAEAGNQTQEGKRLVADVILNRLDSPRFPNDIQSVVSQAGQFTTYKIRNRYVADVSDYDAVISELDVRLDPTVLFFARNHYNGRIPLYKVGDHYFSK